MPRCIAPGCTSGYDSNKEKVHFFYVPKDENMIKLWQSALKRKDFIVKAKQPVCEKHFLHTDILWNRTICDDKGHILGVSAQFKVPRLCKGAIPSIFPWTEETEKMQINIQKENESKIKDVLNTEVSNIDNGENKNLTSLSFNDIINIVDNKHLHIPPQWTYTTSTTYMKHFNKNIKLLIFYLPMVSTIKNYEDKCNIYLQKEVILKENMLLEINILKQPIIIDIPFDVQIHNIIESVEQLKETLFSVNNLNVCLGAVNVTNEIEEIGYDLAYKDISGTWRHKKCTLIISHLLKICKFCSNIKNSLRRKHYRTKIKSLKRIRLSATTTQNEKKLLLLRKKFYKAEKTKKRNKYVAGKLKKELMNCMKVGETSAKTIEDQLKNKKIPNNQLIVIREIIQATKYSNPTGRKYNEEWILLCMLMRMKSPTTYNFLRDNQILPLPCVRTIQRQV
ncbi:uncharacterized protein LOC120357987 [Solenopsis invicta]|uniref:uncharacterized protein LOC120357987 n=1 Tax=Solenopsis invicta TaxID=13686 RepID=UPI00193D61B5|nr:uncharacterized protein LOC120357987 [Solenopsis invicta]